MKILKRLKNVILLILCIPVIILICFAAAFCTILQGIIIPLLSHAIDILLIPIHILLYIIWDKETFQKFPEWVENNIDIAR